MGTIGDEAKAYTPAQLKNITELPSIQISLNMTDEIFGEGENEFTAKIIEVNGEKYRVPNSVLKSLKAILEIKPDLKLFRVTKTGSGLNTEYTVIPLD